MAMGLCNSPATYQRLMEDCLGDLHLSICVIYLDDLIIFSRTYEEHLERLEKVMDRLRECGLKLAPKKCKFFKERVCYVGHVVSECGIEADPAKVEKIRNWPKPTNAEAVRQFLGFAGYYRKFVEHFSRIARPLIELMPTPVKKSGKQRKVVEVKPWVWGEDQDKAFEHLRELLSSPPILGYPDYSLPFELHTDASQLGLGAVLYQLQDGQKRVISYASRGLNKSERNYSAFRLEFLALKWAISEKFNDYLYGHHFTVYTDNNPLTYILTSAKLDAPGHRWLAALAQYDFSIFYRPGSGNADADALSRLPGLQSQLDEFETCTISLESVKAVCQLTSGTPLVESLCMASDVLVDDASDDTSHDLLSMTDHDWRVVQS